MTEPIYAGAAEGYDALFARTTQLFIPALLRAAGIVPGQSVLDVATGTGAAARAAADIVGTSGSVIGGDISPAMIATARRNLEGLPIRLEVLDGQALPFPDCQFDAVTCQLGLMLFPDPARGLSEFLRVLRPGGHAAVSVTTHRSAHCSRASAPSSLGTYLTERRDSIASSRFPTWRA
jgi:ubiquinone/menaquinone biosynthesis C-methylase UbiE